MTYSEIKEEFDSCYSEGLINISKSLFVFMSNLLETLPPEGEVNEALLLVKAIQNGFDEDEYSVVKEFIENTPENIDMEEAFEKATTLEAHFAYGFDQVSLWLTNEMNETAGEFVVSVYYTEFGPREEYWKYVNVAFAKFVSKYKSKINIESLGIAKAQMDNILSENIE